VDIVIAIGYQQHGQVHDDRKQVANEKKEPNKRVVGATAICKTSRRSSSLALTPPGRQRVGHVFCMLYFTSSNAVSDTAAAADDDDDDELPGNNVLYVL